MASLFTNSLTRLSGAAKLCTAMGIRLVTNTQVVHLAANGGFDALFIDLEHSTLSIQDASQHCIVGLQLGMTPFVRVPYQCGNGFIQKVLDGGAMGVIFPHVHGRDDAKAAVSICKYPPLGKRSITGQLPLFSLKATPQDTIISETNRNGSSVFLMIETKESIDNIEDIASVDGADVLLVGSNDLAIELGAPGQFRSKEFRAAMETISQACKKHGKIMGLAGIYDDHELHDWAINQLGVRFLLGGQDSAILARGAKETMAAILKVPK
ncbi:4-hydroxy-2-oxo-heptane-1,7-dioate aldolase [Colletotrichum fructicola]|nr:4-hydroxy-2-oxo-heptane-1,7-dioate aldolase [Colletotrichum fructicola]KAF4932245.1 4-hydroxy-2-oxo-heptane-1,7-dioate aldolase [Colletotrichum fructicola]KAF5498355.1 4-hydroxy-2-oxo-heptane-1,7-dioate aldolase [Colletotrichum fructicola]